jgi:hypothetical protein
VPRGVGSPAGAELDLADVARGHPVPERLRGERERLGRPNSVEVDE